jgi:hypothetical protein
MANEAENSLLLNYTLDSLEIIQRNCRAYEAGSPCCYRVLGVQLRILLCDRKREHNTWRDISLATRMLPHLSFHRLSTTFPIDLDLQPSLPFQTIDPDLPTISILSWLDQDILFAHGKMISIRSLIKFVSEKDGGAHVDPVGFALFDYQDPYLRELIYRLAIYIHTEFSYALEGFHAQPN